MIRHITSALGITLVEQMAALLIGSVMMISFYAFFRSEMYNSLILEAKTGLL